MYTPVSMDKTRNFRFGMRAIAIIEKAFNKPVGRIDFENLTVEETATIIAAGLKHEDNSITADKVIDIIDEKNNLNEVLEAMTQAMNDSFGSGEKTEKN